MDRYQFAANVISSLAWPIAAIVLGSMFRSQIRNLLSKIKSLKAPGGIEAAFEQETKELIADASKPVATTNERAAELEDLQSQTVERLLTMEDLGPSDWVSPDEDLLEVNPRVDRPSSVILRSYFVLEEMMAALIREASVPRASDPVGGKGYYAHSLLTAFLIDKQTADLLKRMRILRDQMIHDDFEPSREAAIDYYITTRKILAKLQSTYEKVEQIKNKKIQ